MFVRIDRHDKRLRAELISVATIIEEVRRKTESRKPAVCTSVENLVDSNEWALEKIGLGLAGAQLAAAES